MSDPVDRKLPFDLVGVDFKMSWHWSERGDIPPCSSDWLRRYGRGKDMTVTTQLAFACQTRQSNGQPTDNRERT